jgi:hypothetical protein
MVRQDIWHTYGAKENGVVLHERIKPIIRHHLAVLKVVITTCKVKMIELHTQIKFTIGSL